MSQATGTSTTATGGGPLVPAAFAACFTWDCPGRNCRRPLRVPESARGQMVRCRHCQRFFRVPAAPLGTWTVGRAVASDVVLGNRSNTNAEVI